MANRRLRHPAYRRQTLPWAHIFGAYVWEDVLILSPFWIIASLVLFFINSLKVSLTFLLLFIAFRSLVEIFYWLFQQFNHTGYRPFDFGFKNLHPQNLYIVYQLLAFSGLVLSVFGLLLVLGII